MMNSPELQETAVKLNSSGQPNNSSNKFMCVSFNLLEKESESNSDIKTVLDALRINNDVNIPLYQHQLDAMMSLAQLKDVILVAPCGSGKTRIIHHAPLIVKLAMEKRDIKLSEIPLAIVNLPLNSIMEDRIRNMEETCNISMDGKLTFSSNEGKPVSELLNSVTHIHGHPESFITSAGKDLLKRHRGRITVHIVDEAHTQFDWGNSFRPLIKIVPGANRIFSIHGSPFLALSATLRPQDIEELLSSYGMSRHPHEIIKINPVLDHIFLSVLLRPSNQVEFYSEDGLCSMLDKICLSDFKKDPIGSKKTLIICQRDTKISDIYADVEDSIGTKFPNIAKRPWVMYHSSLGPKTLNTLHERFQNSAEDPLNLIIASEKLLMGVNIYDIDTVIFVQPPTTLSKFVQGVGRCSRSSSLPFGSRKGVAILLYNKEDLKQNVPGLRDEMRSFCTTKLCLKNVLSEHFGFEGVPRSDWCCNKH